MIDVAHRVKIKSINNPITTITLLVEDGSKFGHSSNQIFFLSDDAFLKSLFFFFFFNLIKKKMFTVI